MPCMICGDGATANVKLFDLLELGGVAHESALHLCGSCMARREALSWPLGTAEGTRLEAALQDRADGLAGRFTYFRGSDEAIHLMRLDPTWVHRHA